MTRSGTNLFTGKVLLPGRVISGLSTTSNPKDYDEEREHLVAGEISASQLLHHLSPLPQLKARSPPAIPPSQHYAHVAREFMSSLSHLRRLLGPEDVKLTDKLPAAAGRFADVREATHGGYKVVLKAHRFYATSDIARVTARFRNEVHISTFLQHEGVEVVPLVGLYSTETHPFGLIYQYMDNLDLRQHLRREPNTGRLELLTGIARSLSRMHDLGVVHGMLEMTNILVNRDGTIRIAGLGNASILRHSTALTVESRTSAGRPLRSPAPGMAGPGMSADMTDATHTTKADDVYHFGVMAFEVLTGRSPFPEMSEITAKYMMSKGNRPSRPNHHGISDRVWYVIERCWNNVPAERMSIREATTLLETELLRRNPSLGI